MRAVADNLSGDDQSPSQTPLVSGGDGLAARAQVKTWGNRASTSSALFFSSTAPYAPPLPLLGSFHKSQARTRGSLANAPTMPCTYSLSRGYCASSFSAVAPGLCTQPELCTPGMGGCCGPSLGKGCLLYTSPSPRDRQKSRMPS